MLKLVTLQPSVTEKRWGVTAWLDRWGEGRQGANLKGGGWEGEKKTQSSAVTSDHRDRSISKMIDWIRQLSSRMEHNGCLLYEAKKKKRCHITERGTFRACRDIKFNSKSMLFAERGGPVDNQHMHNETPTRLNWSAVSFQNQATSVGALGVPINTWRGTGAKYEKLPVLTSEDGN